MKTLQVILISFLCGILSAGVILLIALPPRGQSVQLAPLPTTSPITVYVTGVIQQTGVYSLPPDSRVKDAIQSAGGAVPSADLGTMNLAAALRDGEHLVIPLVGEATQTPVPASPSGTTTTPNSPYSAENPLNINNASQTDLEKLPGVGPTRAAPILAYREAHGPFKKIDDIQNVPGIGAVTFGHLKALITVD